MKKTISFLTFLTVFSCFAKEINYKCTLTARTIVDNKSDMIAEGIFKVKTSNANSISMHKHVEVVNSKFVKVDQATYKKGIEFKDENFFSFSLSTKVIKEKIVVRMSLGNGSIGGVSRVLINGSGSHKLNDFYYIYGQYYDFNRTKLVHISAECLDSEVYPE